MHKKLYLLTIFSFLPIILLGQVKKEILDGIFVTFQNTPEYSLVEGMSMNLSATDNTIALAMVIRNVIPDYHIYVQARKGWSKSEKKLVTESIFSNYIRGISDYSGVKGKTEALNLFGNEARKLTYQAINPRTGVKGTRTSILLLLRNNLIHFEVWDLKENNQQVIRERENFLNSINNQ